MNELVFRPIYRLDRNTSGVLLIAKNIFSCDILVKQLQRKILQKVYFSFVEGYVADRMILDLPIAKKENSKVIHEVSSFGKKSITNCQRCFYLDNIHASFLSITTQTGRTHQIRVHMSYIGHPMLGDFLYGGSKKYIARQALHARSLRFFHPRTDKQMYFFAKMPRDMMELFHFHKI